MQLNRVLTYILPFILLLLLGIASAMGQGGAKGVRTVMIDPGHGGSDPGTVFGDIYEKDISLAVALMLGDLMKKNLPDVKVLYTRTDDTSVKLHERGEKANRAKADLFLSIHVNAVDAKVAPSGALTLVMGASNTDANLDVAMRENDVISYEEDYTTTYEGYIPGSAESFIIFSLMQYVNIDQSMTFANIIQKHYKSSTPMPDRGARQQNLLVLWKTAMPGVLTELGFINNEKDRDVLVSTDGQRKMATALFNAFSEYKSAVEGNSKAILLDINSGTGTTTATVVDATVVAKGGSGSVLYRVQICSSTKKLGQNGAALRPYKDMKITELKQGTLYKYYVGECYTYAEATALQKKTRKTTADAFVVAFDGQRQITVAEAKKKTK